MSATGVWKLTMQTPMGPQQLTADLTVDGAALTGKIESQMGTEQISGEASGDTLSWKMAVTKPMPLTLEFSTKVEGDKMTGNVKLGAFGNAALSGDRA
jgi:hypothetical protein